ncbi:MAG: major capsid protein [Podoviridae sp. ctbj_2]|nr:MAG: major capsid protein [Podoviridae sp. ctbj_2]
MAQNRANSAAFIEDEQYSSLILRNLHDALLPGAFYRNVTDFGSGTVLNIKTLGTVTVQDVAEDVPVDYTPIESGTIQMRIDNYVGDAWYVTDELKEDGAQVEALMTGRAQESTRAIQEVFESRFLARAVSGLVPNAPNPVNGFNHMLVGSGPNNTIAIADFIAMKLAFDKANVPTGGRVAIVDPITAATIESMVTLTSNVTEWPKQIITGGFTRDHRYLTDIAGWTVITSNRLPKGSFGDGTNTVANGVANIFMSIADDNTKPLMAAWRRMPKIESERNKDMRRQEFVTTCRYGFGVQRVDTLGVVVTNASQY